MIRQVLRAPAVVSTLIAAVVLTAATIAAPRYWIVLVVFWCVWAIVGALAVRNAVKIARASE